jgi:hypothetical protein
MLRRIVRQSALLTLLASAAFVGLFGGCGGTDVVLADLDDAAVPSFVVPDAAEASIPEQLTSYCPSNKCPAGYTTCPDSIFSCDVDLKSDIRNCGACGASCPIDTAEKFSCVGGRCVLACKANHLDCDGFPDNGCEAETETGNAMRGLLTEHCGVCNNPCLDPEKPCVQGKCGCPFGTTSCARAAGLPFYDCVNTEFDDNHCGECHESCVRDEDPRPRPPHMYFGCGQGTCNALKCATGFVDCNDDVLTDDGLPNLQGDGCETEVGLDTSCTGCGDSCLAKGQTCLRKPALGGPGDPYCGCPEGETFCGNCASPGTVTIPLADGGVFSFPAPIVCVGLCINLTNDRNNCGACGKVCHGTCEYGTCVQHCPFGRADCDGTLDSVYGEAFVDCEVNTLSDPQNCGGCGIVCDAIAGQACVGGQCVVAPCEQGDGGLTR